MSAYDPHPKLARSSQQRKGGTPRQVADLPRGPSSPRALTRLRSQVRSLLRLPSIRKANLIFSSYFPDSRACRQRDRKGQARTPRRQYGGNTLTPRSQCSPLRKAVTRPHLRRRVRRDQRIARASVDPAAQRPSSSTHPRVTGRPADTVCRPLRTVFGLPTPLPHVEGISSRSVVYQRHTLIRCSRCPR